MNQALRRQKQVDFFAFEDSLVYMVSSGPARAIRYDPILKETEKEREKVRDRERGRKMS